MKAKTYTETVTRCVECPAYGRDCVCELSNIKIHDSWVIPSWCPLEDTP